MRRRCRKVRSRGAVVLNAYSRMVKYFGFIQGSHDWREWRCRSISQRQAEILVAAGEAEAITRLVPVEGQPFGAVMLVGYRALKPTRWEMPSPCTLTRSTLDAIANTVGNKAEIQLTRGERRHVEKFIAWPLIGDTKAIAVRPRISERDRRAAEQMLLQGYLAAAA